jgi:hypothetical protein
MPPIVFLRNCKCNDNEIYTNYLYTFGTYEAIFTKTSSHFQHTSVDVEKGGV